MIDYKNTLNLPQTKFSMRANLVKSELNILHRWHIGNLYQKIRNQKNKKKLFLLHDGPPYANGNIHLGHAVNKILKDIVLKFKGLSGYNAPYRPGWDCHGLPIELQVEHLLKNSQNKTHLSSREFRDICRKYVMDQINLQKKDFIRLGVLGDWENCYLTMGFKTEANIIRSLSKVISNGYFYRGVKPVSWCFQCGSALANLEVEYHDQVCCAVDIGFSVVDIDSINKIFNINLCMKNVQLVIWTTALWTIIANQAVSVHPNYVYCLIKTINNRYIIIATDLVESFMQRIQCSSWKILGESVGHAFEYLKVQHPLMCINVPIILSNHVTLESGTGVVHIAPNYGPDDYVLAKKYDLKNIPDIINDQGYYLSNVPSQLIGLHVFQSNDVLIQLLNQSNNLFHIDNSYCHSYPHCWRHMTPLIFRATSQWFFDMDHNSFRDKLLMIIKEVNWIPQKGYHNMKSMIMNRPDWCLSRQRVWGMPIPILVHKKTEILHPKTFELMEKIALLVEKQGIQVWWDLEVQDILSKEESVYYKKVYDTLDVWFDSGSTHDTVISKEFKYLVNPIDLYLEGSDQYRGWFMSSLIISVAINGSAPYKNVLSHGFTVDSQGDKMSKSIGNTISPQNIINTFGADVLRLWIASVDYSKDMVISNNILKHITDIYRRIRNTIRFCLANLNDFNPKVNLIQPKDMLELDRWIIDYALSIQIKIISNYEQYQFHNVVKYIMQFCSIEMGSFYLDIIKDRQYTLKKNSLARRSCQTALYHIVEAMTRWISPILSFTADEIWQYMPGCRSLYIFTEEWYNGLFVMDKNQLMSKDGWSIFFSIREKVNKLIEQSRINGLIKKSLEADIIVYTVPTIARQLHILGTELAFGLMVSSVVISDSYKFDVNEKRMESNMLNFKIILKKSKGKKCFRCWNYTLDVGKHKNYVNICSRCVENIIGSGENRRFF